MRSRGLGGWCRGSQCAEVRAKQDGGLGDRRAPPALPPTGAASFAFAFAFAFATFAAAALLLISNASRLMLVQLLSRQSDLRWFCIAADCWSWVASLRRTAGRVSQAQHAGCGACSLFLLPVIRFLVLFLCCRALQF